MQKLRQNMPAVIIFLVIMFIALIIFEWGAQRSGGGMPMGGTTSIGEVNGVEISAADYESRVAEAIESQRTQNPDGEIEEQPIREAVWNQIIEETLVQQAAEEMGIRVSDEELREVLLYDPPSFLKQQFTDSTGFFDQSIYQSFLTDIDGFLSQRQFPRAEIEKYKLNLVKIQEAIRKDRLREAVQSVVVSTAVLSPADAFSAYIEQKSKASGTFAMLDISTIPDAQVTVSDAEAKKYYDEHKADFQQKASREIHYAFFPLNPSTEDSSTMNRRLAKISEALAGSTSTTMTDSLFGSWSEQYGSGKYDGTVFTPLQEIAPELQNSLNPAKAGTVIGPVQLADGKYLLQVIDVKDSGDTYVKAQHILLKTEPGANDDSVRGLAQTILQRAKSGDNFDLLAQQNSADPGSAQKGGDLGYFKKGMMVKPFEDAAFGAALGSIVGPVKSDFGYHIIKVNDRSALSYKLRDLKFEVRVSNPTKNMLRRRAQEFHAKLTEGISIDSLGKRENIQVLESGPVQQSQPVAGSARLANFAYQGEQGDVSEVIQLSDGSLAIAQLTKVQTAGVKDYAGAKDEIMKRLMARKKLDQLKQKAEKMRAALSPGDSLSKLTTIDPAIQIQSFDNVTPTGQFPGVGLDYALNAAVFNQKPGQLSPLITGDRGYYIVKLDSLSAPTQTEFETERKQFVEQLMQQRRGQMFQQWLQKAKERANIVDSRNF